MNEPHDPSKILIGGGEHAGLTQSALEQIADHLDALQAEYGQIRSWLEGAYDQFARQEAQIGQRLCQMTVLMEQLRNSMSAVNLTADPPPGSNQEENPSLTLRVCTFAQFQACYADQVLFLGHSKKGSTIFRYLFTRPERRAAKETLLELFWPGEPADKANHKLHIAISALRQALDQALTVNSAIRIEEGALLFKDECYFLNPAIPVWLDADEFTRCYHAGQQLEQQGCAVEAFAQYETGRSLCRGDFLTEDLYADWSAAPRARLEEMYLTLLGRLATHYFDQGRFEESILCCRQILDKDSFREDAYRQLMRCYCRMGQRNQALREFHLCAQTLQRELGVSPVHETVALYEQIAREG